MSPSNHWPTWLSVYEGQNLPRAFAVTGQTSVVDLKFLPELLHARRRNFKSKTTLVSYTC
jgi:hypothetical protein